MKYDDAFIKKVKEHWYANKGKELYTTKTKDVHKSSYTYKKKVIETTKDARWPNWIMSNVRSSWNCIWND